MDGKKKSELARTITQYIMYDNSEVRDEFFNYAKDGAIPLAEAMQIWNGKPLLELSESTLKSLYDFFSQKYELKSADYYFSQETHFYESLDDDKKNLYLQTKDNQYYLDARSFLSRISKLGEQQFGKDICEMSVEELEASLSNMRYTNRRSLDHGITMLRDYIKWCNSQGFYCPNFNEINALKVREIAKNVRLEKATQLTLLSGPDQLAEIIEVVYNPDKNNTGVILSILVWLGIPVEQAVVLEQANIIITEDSVVINGVSQKLPQSLIKIMRQYIYTDEISVESSNNVTRRFIAAPTRYFVKHFHLSSDPTKLEKYRDIPMDIQSCRTRIKEIGIKYREETGIDKRFNERTIKNSGAMWRLKQIEDSGVKITNDLIQKILNVSSLQTTLGYMKMYKMYKTIFY